MRRAAALVASVVALLPLLPASAGARGPGAAPSGGGYRPPVDAPVVDGFRPPPEPWLAGNRGVDYGTAPGTPVRAAADGEVVFAGAVGGSLHVVVLHPDGVRTTYAFLRTITVTRGQAVVAGQVVGTTAGQLHFGARVGDRYIDPLALFAEGPPEVHLVPSSELRALSEPEERQGLLAQLWDGGRALAGTTLEGLRWVDDTLARGAGAASGLLADAGADALDGLGALGHYARELQPLTRARRLAEAVAAWRAQRGRCTPPSTPPPAPAGERRIAVLVAGLGSRGGAADGAGRGGGDALDALDTADLGYAGPDVVRYSYRGGAVEDNPYGPADTTVDLRQSARGLRELLARIAAEHPGVPVDLIAHSQGGIVARQMLAFEYGDGPEPLPPVRTLVTLGTPHQGADLATALTAMERSGLGGLALDGVEALAPGTIPRGPAVEQLSETSSFMGRLGRQPLPTDVRVTSIAARGDLVVPALRSRLDGAANVVVSVEGLATDHSELPGSAAARREVALALAGLPPTCQTLADMVLDAVTAEAIGFVEDQVGLAATLAGAAGPPGGP